MEHHFSFGIIPLQKVSDRWRVLLIRHLNGNFWAFPKGHAEKNETPEQTAIRELKEETNLSIKQILSPHPLIEKYFFRFHGRLISKTVSYFIAEVEGEIALQQTELSESRWVDIQDVDQHVTFKEAKTICYEVQKFLSIKS